MLEHALTSWGHQVTTVADGRQAWDELNKPEPPPLAILDWQMPGPTGPELCRRIREHTDLRALYVILLTAMEKQDDIVSGLEAGADDYIIKPYKPAELRARINVGARVIELQQSLTDRVAELEEALSQVRTLQGLIPICAYCKRIRNEREYWERVESYIGARADVKFTHGICPDCLKAVQDKYGLEP